MATARDQDARTDEELFAVALQGHRDSDEAWSAVAELHVRGTRSILETAQRLLHSEATIERARGADVLGQLGAGHRRPPEDSENFFREQRLQSLLDALTREASPQVLHSIGVALGHVHDARAVGPLVGFKSHPDADVRFGVVLGLSGQPDERAVEALVELSADVDEDVRNWATFELGSQIESVDTPQLREALFQRLGDANDEVRGEALVGLAVRKDPRVLEPLMRALKGRPVLVLAVEAAETLGDKRLLPLLVRIRHEKGKADSYFRQVLMGAIAALEALP